MSPLPDILNYSDYRHFLADLYAQRKAASPQYSYRRFAEDLGFTASNFMHLVVSGKRNLSLDAVNRIRQHLDWRARDKNYFQTLVLFNQCENEDEKKKLAQDLERILKKRRTLINPDQFQYFSTWYVPVIREIVALKNFVSNLNWISRKLRPHVDEDQVKKALGILERLGMILRQKGRWAQNQNHLTTATEVTSDMVYNYHREMLSLSQQALAHPADERDISAMTMSVSPAQFQAIKQRIIDFRDDLQQELQDSSSTDANVVAQLNIQFFKVTE